MTRLWGEYIRTEHHTLIVPRHLRYFAITVFFILILLFTAFQYVSAETPEQPVQNPLTQDNAVISPETNTGPAQPASIGEQGEHKTDSPPQPEAKTETPQQPESTKNPCASQETFGETWLDQTHDFVSMNICEPAVWFDNFFGDYNILDDVRPGAFIRLRDSVRWSEGNHVNHLNDYRIQWRFPKMKKKFKFFIVGGSDIEKVDPLSDKPIESFTEQTATSKQSNIGVRYDFFKWLRSLVSIDTGIRVHIPLDPFVRIRYQYTIPFADVYLARFSETAVWRYIEHFSETTQLDLERKLDTFMLLRWSGSMTYAEGTAGIKWNTGISLLTELSPRSAISLDTSTWGVNRPEWTIDNYRVGTRYRRNFYRPWLFFEIEPEVTWPKKAGGYRDPLFAITFLIEIQFGR